MADFIPPLVVGVQLDPSGLNSGIATAEGNLNRLGTTAVAQQSPLGSLSKTLGALGMAFGAYQVFNFSKSLLDAAESEKVSNSRLENITKQMDLFGGAAGEVSKRLEDLATKQALATGQDEDAIKATDAKLMTFKNLAQTASDAGGMFDRASQAAQDLAAAGFGEMEQNATQLGKALQDPVKGIGALARSGVTFTEQEKESIKKMMEHNNVAGAQEMIMAAIEKQVGGTAEATATGSAKMGQAFEQLKETLGAVLMPAVEGMSEGFAAAFGWIADNLPTVGTFVGVLTVLAVALNATAIATSITNSALWGMVAALLANPITWIVLGIAALTAGIVWLATKTTFFQDAWKAMTAWVTSAWNATVKWLGDGFAAIGKWFADLPKNIMKLFSDAVGWLASVGGNLIKGLWNGLQTAWKNFVGWFADLVDRWVEGIKNFFGIHSPSTMFHGFGQNIVQGLMNGIDSMQGALASTMAGMQETVSSGLSVSATVSGVTGSGMLPSGAAVSGVVGGVVSSATVAGQGGVTVNAPVSVQTNATAQDISASVVNAIKFNLPYITSGRVFA